MSELIIAERKYGIIELPGRPKALLDHQVAEIYQVETKRINEAVERNTEKFPPDFVFQLTLEEKEKVVANCDRLSNLKYSSVLPKAFTWEGCNMLATILKSDVATQRAIQIVKGFTAVEKKVQESSSLSALYPEVYQSTHPLMMSMRQVIEVTTKYVQVEEEQKRMAEVQHRIAEEQRQLAVDQARQERSIRELEVKTSAIIERTGYYTILAFAKLRGIYTSTELALKLGKQAATESRRRGYNIGHVPDERYGTVNTYHSDILHDVFGVNN